MNPFDASFINDLVAINYYLIFFLVFFIALTFFKVKFIANNYDKQHIFLGLLNIFLIGFFSPFTALQGNILSNKYHFGFFFWLSKTSLPLSVNLFLQVIFILLFFDFLFYFYHRFVHKHSDRFTSFHLIHHQLAIPDKNWGQALRLHFIDFFFLQLIKFLLAIFLSPNLIAWIVADIIILIWIFFIHQQSSWDFSQKFFVTYNYHHIHHASVQAGTPCAFSLIFKLWDKIFKTEGAELTSNGISSLAPPPSTIKEIFKLLYHPIWDIFSRNGTRKQNSSN